MVLDGCTLPYPGFPSLHVLPVQEASTKPIKLNCFGSDSRYETFVLTMMRLPEMPETATLAANVLGE